MSDSQQSDYFSGWEGKTLNGRYEIQALMRQDEVTAVFRATDPTFDRTVSITFFSPQVIASVPQFETNFPKQVNCLAQLNHPNIERIYDFGQYADIYYLVSEWIKGETLENKLARLNDRLHQEETIRIAREICNALAYAHRHDAIHRDLRPAHIMLRKSGTAVLTNFGLVQSLQAEQTAATGVVFGHAEYMSPEQIMGKRIDGRSDLYALGVILFEMVAGRRLFEADNVIALAHKHVYEPIPNLQAIRPDSPARLVRIIEKALSKDRDNRYQSAAEMQAALTAASKAEREWRAVEQAGPPGDAVGIPDDRTQIGREVDQNTGQWERAKSLRLDVASPDRVAVGRAFDLAVAVRQLLAPKLSEADLQQVKSGMLRVNWPLFRRAIRLRLEVSAPDCRFHGKSGYTFRLRRHKNSPVFYFHLTPEKAGVISIIVTIYQQKDWLGSARIHTTAQEQLAGRVGVKVASQIIEPDTLAQLRQNLAAHFNLDELRTLCFDLGIDHENFPVTKDGLTRELIAHCQRQNRMTQLLEHCRQLRPGTTWKL